MVSEEEIQQTEAELSQMVKTEEMDKFIIGAVQKTNIFIDLMGESFPNLAE